MDCAKKCLIRRSKSYESDNIIIGFAKPRIGLIFFVIDNLLILLLAIYFIKSLFYIKYTVNPTGKSNKNHNDKKDENST